jgi:serine protease
MSPYFLKSLIASVVFVLTGCGGGGDTTTAPDVPSSSGESQQGANRTLSGTISIDESSAIDSDTNNSKQAGRKSNNEVATAQKISTPITLLGSVNLVNKGPEGPNLKAGDTKDVYYTKLQEGQVVELEFSADAKTNDLDLVLVSEDASLVGTSLGSGGYECVRVTKTGNYYLAVGAMSGASIYNMQIAAPSASSACQNATVPKQTTGAGEVVVKRLEGAARLSMPTSLQTRLQTAAQDDVQIKQALATDVPALIRLPAAKVERAQALSRVSALAFRNNGEFAEPTLTALASEANSAAVALNDELETAIYAKTLMQTGLFAYVEPNRHVQLEAALVGEYPPIDKLYAKQRWHYEMIGMPAAMSRLVVAAPQLSTRPLVAVIDSGIVSDHPELAPQIEAQASFTNNGTFSDSADDPSVPTQAGGAPGFHGTHVAGTIAAATFDDVGVAGVAPMAQLLPLRVFGKNINLASYYDTTQAILFAAGLPNSSGRLPKRRADVINMSLGGTGPCPANYADVIRRARAAGVIVVAAAGNEKASAVSAPANCPGVISVGATDAQRQKTSYSNSGAGLTVVAPGGDGKDAASYIYSTIGAFVSGTRTASYGYNLGTSMASPHVAGVMALMRYANPDITPDQVGELFAAGKLTDDLGAAGYDTSYGWGMVNARKAVDEALALKGAPTAPVEGLVVAQPSSLDFGALRTSGEFTLSASAATAEKVASITSSSPAVKVEPKTVDAATKLGTYTVTVDRSTLPAGSSSFVNLTVTTNKRQLTVQISVRKNATGSTNSQADFGTVYVALLNADTSKVLGSVETKAVNGRYTWRYTGPLPSKVQILAGTDIDNDNQICQRGEACGTYPAFAERLPVIYITGDRNDLNFGIAPLGGLITPTGLNDLTTAPLDKAGGIAIGKRF